MKNVCKGIHMVTDLRWAEQDVFLVVFTHSVEVECPYEPFALNQREDPIGRVSRIVM